VLVELEDSQADQKGKILIRRGARAEYLSTGQLHPHHAREAANKAKRRTLTYCTRV
jgi:hypothetical protein